MWGLLQSLKHKKGKSKTCCLVRPHLCQLKKEPVFAYSGNCALFQHAIVDIGVSQLLCVIESNTLRNINTHCPYSSQFLGPWDSLVHFQLIEFYYSFPLGMAKYLYSLGLACMADPANEQDLGLRVWILTNYVVGRLSMIWARQKESFFFFFFGKQTHTHNTREKE